MSTGDPQLRIQLYLWRLRRQLRGGSAGVVNEILAELQNHIVERATIAGEMTEASVEDVLQRLGRPENLAEQYAIDFLPSNQESDHPHGRLENETHRWTRLIAAVPILLVAAIGYFLGAALFICAVLKPFHPYSAGLWRIPDSHDIAVSLRLGFGSGFPPTGSADLLGWWIIPGGLVLGLVLLVVATRLALWSFRLSRDPRSIGGDYRGGFLYGR
jgi:hypothetical protein